MMENNESTRQTTAENKVERLEKEIEALRNRLKQSRNNSHNTHSNVAMKESEKIRFQLSEQVKDLKVQLKYQQTEYSRLQESSNRKTGELEEKIKRMREIFGQATKNIDNYRATIAEKDIDIGKLSTELEECQVREHKYKSMAESSQQMADKLNNELTSDKAHYESEIKQLEGKNRQLAVQWEQTKNNYEQYKKRAHMLIEKSHDKESDEKRIHELEVLVQQLQLQKGDYETQLLEKEEKRTLLEGDIKKAVDHITALESRQKRLMKERDMKEDMLQTMHDKLLGDYRMLEEKLRSYISKYEDTQNELNRMKMEYEDQSGYQHDKNHSNEEDSDKKEEVIQSYAIRVQELESLVQSLHTQLMAKENEIEQLLITTPISPPLEESQLEIQDVDEGKYEGNDVYASMSNLLSPLVSRQTPDEKTILERQVQQLSQLLQESDERVNALRNQEKLLKDELRKIDGLEKRENINVEYLKNVFIKFLTSENKQAMVPIIAKLLYLDQAETESIMNSVLH